MSMQKVLMGVATVIAVGVGSLWAARDKKSVPPSPEEQRWPRSTRLGTQLDHPSGVAADTQYLYFVTGGFQQAENAVKRVALTGGAVETLASGDFMTGGHIACDERFVYWTTQGSSMSVRGEFLSKHFERGFDLFAEVLNRPSFPEAEVARERHLQLQDIAARAGGAYGFSRKDTKEAAVASCACGSTSSSTRRPGASVRVKRRGS